MYNTVSTLTTSFPWDSHCPTGDEINKMAVNMSELIHQLADQIEYLHRKSRIV